MIEATLVHARGSEQNRDGNGAVSPIRGRYLSTGVLSGQALRWRQGSVSRTDPRQIEETR